MSSGAGAVQPRHRVRDGERQTGDVAGGIAGRVPVGRAGYPAEGYGTGGIGGHPGGAVDSSRSSGGDSSMGAATARMPSGQAHGGEWTALATVTAKRLE